MTNDELLIREAIAAEAEQAVDSGTVLATMRRGAKPRRRRTLIVALAGGAVAAGIIAVAVPLTASREATPPATVNPPPPAATEKTLLLLGMDNFDHPDAIVLARFGVDGSVRGVSLPRDTSIGGDLRLNAVYSKAGRGDKGAQATVAEVEKLTGVRADHYAVVTMAGFAQVSSAVGGVEVCLKTSAKDAYSQADFKAGKQVVSGEQALAFLRQRHGLPMGDLDRIARQQMFLRALIAKLGRADAQQVAALSDALSKNVQTDPGLRLLDLARALTSTSTVTLGTIPWSPPDGRSPALTVDPKKVREFTGQTFNGTSGDSPGDCVN